LIPEEDIDDNLLAPYLHFLALLRLNLHGDSTRNRKFVTVSVVVTSHVSDNVVDRDTAIMPLTTNGIPVSVVVETPAVKEMDLWKLVLFCNILL